MREPMNNCDEELACSGDVEAFTRLIKKNERSMYRVARTILQSENECLDAAQEAILKAYHSLSTLREPRLFHSWLMRILVNECHRLARKTSKLMLLDDWQEPASPYRFEENIELQEAVQFLEKELRLCIVLYYFEDMAIKDMAVILRQPEGTIKSRLSRARKKLAAYFTSESTEWRKGYE
ncbi:RNA polymerase sigma factor [Brevibacillus panacihumi W25]|uniref:RNA polymerase sigma factor n=1 Tax=Brevibacillus panacihumi W25 TaxID=1408254 RepID=V6M8S5_9BACL|nr:sigma-70 family RNA polymerase sigma factor [Brevibacillus panacihumi]EST54939.1 RNA polymerase sigma factor [Brevibacillus panacihumi W25]